jgi:hypothetical protein
MSLKSNGGTLTINKVADVEGFEEEVWFSTEAMTNILSFALVRAEYNISYDGEAFIVHCSDNGYDDMVFIPYSSGLHVYNPEDPRGLSSYSFFETVEHHLPKDSSGMRGWCKIYRQVWRSHRIRI